MSFEALKRVLRGGTAVASQAQKDEVLGGYPVTENLTGLPKGTVITKIGKFDVIVPVIRKEAMSPTIVMEATIDGKERPVYLSSLIRKGQLDDPFVGMIATHDNFKGCEGFTNQEWVEAFQKSTPFRVTNVTSEERTIQTGAGERKIKPKVLTLEHGAK